MRILKFIVDGQIIRKDPFCDFGGIAKGTKGYLYAEFALSEEWKDCMIAASFWRYSNEYAVPVIDGKCKIPAQALVGNDFYVQLTGIRNGLKIKTNKVRVEQEG